PSQEMQPTGGTATLSRDHGSPAPPAAEPELARLIGINPTGIGLDERGTATPAARTVVRLNRVLGAGVLVAPELVDGLLGAEGRVSVRALRLPNGNLLIPVEAEPADDTDAP